VRWQAGLTACLVLSFVRRKLFTIINDCWLSSHERSDGLTADNAREGDYYIYILFYQRNWTIVA